MKVGVIDYDAGNLASVSTALRFLGADFIVSPDHRELDRCDRLIFPGVGEAFHAMHVLRERSLDTLLQRYAASGRPLLGICIGCQLVLDHSEERDTDCLGIIPGKVLLFPERKGLKVPHMGWNSVRFCGDIHPLFSGIPDGTSFYFVHSYYPQVDRSLTIAECDYGETFSAAFARDNIAAMQFHPEKSGPFGLRLLKNFLSWNPGGAEHV
ncbi:imidazole glycerol phosphate synthase subunit HisH [Sediminispirochaeta bajacaliforniensis]|uniref:imidazole glycerol phosphate synthase subunit HisH n=1 Tax=Sediminispirochaeta bajacaliforniensis TaxID=148 RepID=UPI00037AD053|nr:imidazole glycerol phosphate synthase subunit HisH [Sediminispirochaeta bajacaliforniensis]